MTMKRRCGSYLLLVVLFLTLCPGCAKDSCEATIPDTTVAPREKISVVEAESLYNTAINEIAQTENLAFSILSERTVTLGETTFSENCTQKINCYDYGTDHIRIYVNENRNIGTYTIESKAAFEKDTAYFTIGDGHFKGSMSAETFVTRYAPAVLIDSSLYRHIQVAETDEIITLIFTDPTEPEPWLSVDKMTEFSAEGKVVFDSNGALVESFYEYAYPVDDALIQESFHVIFVQEQTEETINESDYILLSDPEVPLLLEYASGYLLHADRIGSVLEERIICDAYGDERVQRTILEITGENATLAAKLTVNVELINHNRGGEQSESSYVMEYTEGHYSTWENSEIKQDSTLAQPETVRTQFQNLLLGTILLPEYVSSVDITDQEDAYFISFSADRSFAIRIRQTLCGTLYQDPDLLAFLEQQELTEVITAYLTVEKVTGLPLASGIVYQGEFDMAGNVYSLQGNIDQKYYFAQSVPEQIPDA